MSSTAESESLSRSMLDSLSLSNKIHTQSEIPPFFLPQILSLLPLKSIAQSRCVCKSWNSLISSPYFIHHHISSSRFKSDSLLVLSKLGRFPVDDDPIYHLLPPPSGPENGHPQSLGMPHNPDEYGSFPIGVVHGIVCIFRIAGSSVRNIILWNPVTRKEVSIPETRNLMVHGFGYDPLTKQLKVVATRKIPRSSKVEVHVVSHRGRQWKKLTTGAESDPLCVNKQDMLFQGPNYDGCVNWLRYDESNKGCVANEHHYYEGNIHWLRHDVLLSGWFLVAFDCAKDEFRKIELPEELVGCKAPRELIWGPRGKERPDYDKLVAAQCGDEFSVLRTEIEESGGCKVHIWVIGEYGEKESWAKLFTVPMKGEFVGFRMVWEDDEVLLWRIGEDKLTAFGSNGSVVKRKVRYPGLVLDCYAFKESLLLMDV